MRGCAVRTSGRVGWWQVAGSPQAARLVARWSVAVVVCLAVFAGCWWGWEALRLPPAGGDRLGVALAVAAVLAAAASGPLFWWAPRTAAAPAPPVSAPGRVGWSLAEVRDPFALEVHRAVNPAVPQPGLPPLPAYVPREHDAALAKVVTAAAAGTSGIAVLVGGSSTGKTRACWQALKLLRGQEPGWRLWHPIDPRGALAGLPGVGPRTVVWLNEAQRSLGTADGVGERVAAGLRELLRDGDRGPVLALATLWPEFWAELTVRPAGGADPYAQARELLVGHDIPVPAKFDDDRLRELQEAGDPRLAQAAAGSRDGQVIQYLAGAPELLARYHNAPLAARAVIDAAMDAARLGVRGTLPGAFLEAAAPGYLTDTEWELLPGDWLKQALDYTAKPAKGVRGPLTPVQPRPGVQANSGDGRAWQLADYLDQYGRRTRLDRLGPATLWNALATYTTNAADLTRLAQAARDRGLYRRASALWTTAVAHGETDAASALISHLCRVSPGDTGRAARWAASHARLDEPWAVGGLVKELREAGASDAVEVLAARASLDDLEVFALLLWALGTVGARDAVQALAARAASDVSLDDPGAVALLLGHMRRTGADDAARTLLARDPASHANLDHASSVTSLLLALNEAGARDAVQALAARAASEVSLDNTRAVADLLQWLCRMGAGDAVATLLARDPASHARLDDPGDVAPLLWWLHEAGADDAVQALAARAASDVSLDNTRKLAWLLGGLRKTGADDAVQALAARAASDVSLDNTKAVAWLLDGLRKAGADDAARTLLARDPAGHANLDDVGSVNSLLRALDGAGARDAVQALAARAASDVSLDNTWAVAWLLGGLRKAGADDAARTLLARDPASHANLDRPDAVAELLWALREAGAGDAARILAAGAARAVTHASYASPDDPRDAAWMLWAPIAAAAESTGEARPPLHPLYPQLKSVVNIALEHAAVLMRAVRGAGAGGAAWTLAARAANAGAFSHFLEAYRDEASNYPFGREPNGAPSESWNWQEPTSDMANI